MNRMYLALALISLFGAILAPQETWAEEGGKTELSPTRLVEQNRHLAEAAQRESAASAAGAVRDATKVDLDIRVLGHNSVLIAGDFNEVL
jgi:hypothetical protein